MNYPVFIFHELALSLSQIRPEIGKYDSIFIQDDLFMITTTKGQIVVDAETIAKQYQDPSLLSKDDLEALANSFRSAEKPELVYS